MEPLLLLHGALGSKKQFDELVPKLREHMHATVYRINFEGHGTSGPVSSPFRIEYFVENVLGFIDEHKLPKVNIFGYSIPTDGKMWLFKHGKCCTIWGMHPAFYPMTGKKLNLKYDYM